MEVSVPEVDQAPDSTDPGVNIHRVLARPVPRRLFILVSLMMAVAFRTYVALSRAGGLDSDEAIVGLMARHILEGEFPIFYWGQDYGGTAEVFLTAGVFRLFDSSTVALRVVPLALWGVAAFLIWRIAKRLTDEPGASLAALLFLVWPSWLVWKSLHAHGYYGVLLVVSTAALLLALQISDEPRWPRYAALGVLLGLGWWTSPQIALIGLPIMGWLLAYRNTRRWAGLLSAGAGFALGALPWWWWNAANGWASLVEKLDAPATTYWGRLSGLARDVLPMALGLRTPFQGELVLPGWGAGVLYAVLLAAFIWFTFKVVRERNRRLLLLICIAFAFPWVYALSEHTGYSAEPRYLASLFPTICLIIGYSFNRSFTVMLAALMLTLPLTFVGLRDLHPPTSQSVLDGPRPPLSPVIEVLERHDERYAIAEYWTAYRISFVTREEIIATATDHARYQPHDALVRAQPAPAYVFLTGSPEQMQFEAELATAHPGYIAGLRDEYTVYLDPR